MKNEHNNSPLTKKNRLMLNIFVFYSLIILVLTVYPRIDLHDMPNIISSDKLAHIIQFFIFSLLYYKMRIINYEKKPIKHPLFIKWYEDINTKLEFKSLDDLEKDKIINYSLQNPATSFSKDIFLELFFLGALVSIFMESLQFYIPGRTFCWYDILANLLGFYLFITISYLFQKKKEKCGLVIMEL